MKRDQLKDGSEVLVCRDGETIGMIAEERDGDQIEASLPVTGWQSVVPILLANRPALAVELLADDVSEDSPLQLDLDDDLRSLFWFATVARGMGNSRRILPLARGWAALPVKLRARWWERASSRRLVHSQILGRVQPTCSVFEQHVPEWLRNLARINHHRSLILGVAGARWNWATTPIGRTCVFQAGKDRGRGEAVLVISDCHISCRTAGDRSGSLALAAIDTLIAAQQEVLRDPKLAAAMRWEISGHDHLEMQDTLSAWRARLAPPSSDSRAA